MDSETVQAYLRKPAMFVPPINLWNLAWFQAGWRKAVRCPACKAYAVQDGQCRACDRRYKA
jgi:hypothetical protein